MESADTRERIIEAAASLLTQRGREAVSTRAVSAAAGVQAPTIYRIFGDKQRLLDAVVTHGFETYLADKRTREPDPDPVEDLRQGWDLNVGFGLDNPACYVLMCGDPRPGAEGPAVREGATILAGVVRRIAEAGRLRATEERAVHLIHAAASGVTLTLIGQPEGQRDLALSTMAREAIIAAITTEAPYDPSDTGPVTAAVSLRAVLPQTDALSPHERGLLEEWLDRIATAPASERQRE